MRLQALNTALIKTQNNSQLHVRTVIIHGQRVTEQFAAHVGKYARSVGLKYIANVSRIPKSGTWELKLQVNKIENMQPDAATVGTHVDEQMKQINSPMQKNIPR